MPLHSSATWMVTPGSSNTKPSRWKGMPVSRKNSSAMFELCVCRKEMIVESSGSGIGTVKKRNRSGKHAARKERAPKHKANAPSHIRTTAKISNEYGFVNLKCHTLKRAKKRQDRPEPKRGAPNFQSVDKSAKISFFFI